MLINLNPRSGRMTVVFALAITAMFPMSVRAEIPMPIPRETVPTSLHDKNAASLGVPYLEKGILYFAQVRKPTSGKATTDQTSWQIVGGNVYRLADVNRGTGEYLYQTISNEHQRNIAGITTWLGNKNGQSRPVFTGAGYVKLSPGGTYVAITDAAGTLRIVDQTGRERSVFGSANGAIFSPDGTKIAFLNTIPHAIGDAGGISIVDLASGKTLTTYWPDGGEYIPLAFSRDGNVVFFTADATMANDDPGNSSRVDVYALTVSGNAEPQLVTKGELKLPYRDYVRIQYLADPNLLALAAEDSIWVLNTRTGAIQTIPDVIDGYWAGETNTLIARSSDKDTTTRSWNIITTK